jgi:type I restriction enzyme S subunit
MTNKNIPKLRFKEFNKNWTIKKLSKISTIQKGTQLNKEKLTDTGKYPAINGGINPSGYTNKSNSNKNTITISEGGNSCGYVNFITSKFWSGGHCYNIENLSKTILNNFLFQFLKFNQNTIMRLRVGSGLPNIQKKDISNVNINIPEIKEQMKIANFLFATDKKLEQFKQKQQLLQNYKNGIMQQMFSQKIRFKNDDCDLPDWENKKLGDIGKTFNGLTGKTKIDFGKGKPYIQYKQIFDNSKINTSNFGLVNITDNDKQNRANYGDVFFTTSSETPEEVGYSSVLLDDIKGLYLNSFCFGYRVNSLEELNPNFLQYLFRDNSFRKPVRKLAQGSTRYNISKIQTMKISVNIPEIKEQAKIANFLSVLDKKINLLIQQTDISKDFKKSLLQKMFV